MTQIFALLTALASLSVVISKPIIEITETPVSMHILAKINAAGANNFVEAQRARIKQLKANGPVTGTNGQNTKRNAVNVPVTNAVVTYEAVVGIGSPPTRYTLLVDTGSSNTWVGAGKKYNPTSTSVSTGNNVSVGYGSGFFSGTEYTDTISLASGLVISNQSIGVASTSSGFDGFDGILGIGPVDLTEGTVSSTDTVPTVTDNLFSQGTISGNEIGISFEPTTSASSKNGELTFGGTDSSKLKGSITYTSITKTNPASAYWGIDQTINYNGQSIQSSTAGIVDTGTTLVFLTSDAFANYKNATGATLDEDTGLLTVTKKQYASMHNLNFVISGTTFALTPNAQIFPRALNTQLGGVAGKTYLIVANLETPTGEGFDFVNGYTFLERFYSVFDTANKRVGFATTKFTNATTN